MEFTIVVIGYNREGSLERLLKGLNRSYYGNDKVRLIISLDKSDNLDILKLAINFEWKYGEKIVKESEVKMGLRKHIIKCGDLTEIYGNLIVFEDDILPSPAFYNYVKQAVSFYEDNNSIAGISLYHHATNVNCNRPFENICHGYDTFFMKYAQSWGQVWTKKMWNGFKRWYIINKENDVSSRLVPKFVSGWPESSWLKYYIKYIIEEDKYFIYPNISLSTNFTDIGEHAKGISSGYQVNIELDYRKKYKFPTFGAKELMYDQFFENEGLNNWLLLDGELCVDIYGEKKYENKKYVLTMEKKNNKILKSYSLRLRPHELNIICDIEGNDLFLYDIEEIVNNKFDNIEIDMKKLSFDIKNFTRKDIFKLIIFKYKRAIINKIIKKWNYYSGR